MFPHQCDASKTLHAATFKPTANAVLHCFAPGRVNLIGEHVDYTGGFVLPLAINYGTAISFTSALVLKPSESAVNLVSSNTGSTKIVTISITDDMKPMEECEDSWTNYVVGVLIQYIKDLPATHSIQCSIAISGDVPLGSGLSSSASLEVCSAVMMENIFDSNSSISKYLYSTEEKLKYPTLPNTKGRCIARAIRSQRAENEFCSSPCGIMDQYVSSAASLNTLLLIDCETNDFEAVHVADGAVLIVCNSSVKHSVAGGEYPKRVMECKEATNAIRITIAPKELKNLRHATMKDLINAKKSMSEIAHKRAYHTITENFRTLEAADKLRTGDFERVGVLMNESHDSLNIDFDVSCDELNFLQKAAIKLDGVYGSRMTGGGFGGCTVTLCEVGKAQVVMEELRRVYFEESGVDCLPFVTGAGGGARMCEEGRVTEAFKMDKKAKWALLVGWAVVGVAVLVHSARRKR